MIDVTESLLEQPVTHSVIWELSDDTREKVSQVERPYLEYMDAHEDTLRLSEAKRLTKRAFMSSILAGVTHNLLLPESKETARNIELLQQVHTIVDREMYEPDNGVVQDLAKLRISLRNLASVGSAMALYITEHEYPVGMPDIQKNIGCDRAIVSKSMQALRLEAVVGDSVLEEEGSRKTLAEPLAGFIPRFLNDRLWRSQLYLQHTSQKLGIDSEAATDLLISRGFDSVAQSLAKKSTQ